MHPTAALELLLPCATWAARILPQEFSLGGFIFSLFIHLDQIPELLN